jgi:hypothetical protein
MGKSDPVAPGLTFAEFMEEIKGIAYDNLLNQRQKREFIESTFADFFLAMNLDDLPGIQAALRMARSARPSEAGPNPPPLPPSPGDPTP